MSPDSPPPDDRFGTDDVAATLRRELIRLIRPVADVCGLDSPVFRLLCRGVYGPTADAGTALKRLRLARYAVDELPRAVRHQLVATSGCVRSGNRLRRRPTTFSGSADRAPMILVVDHRAERAEATALALAGAGYRTLRVADAQTALTAAALVRPCLVVVDVLLPSTGGVDGTGVIARLLVRDVPVVVRCSLNVTSGRPDLIFVGRAGDHEDLLAAVARLLWAGPR